MLMTMVLAMGNPELLDKFGWWGKYEIFDEDEHPRLIYIGPMSRQEMINLYSEFPHNFMESYKDAPSDPLKDKRKRDKDGS